MPSVVDFSGILSNISYDLKRPQILTKGERKMKKPTLVEKDFLNPEETIELFSLSRRKFYRLIKEGKQLGFLALYGSRRLIIRGEFERYLEANPKVKEGLKNASRKNKGTA